MVSMEEDELPQVRILVLGDEKVGKTSLISTFVSQHFSERVPSIMHPVQIPAEENQDEVSTLIMDSSSQANDQSQVIEQIYQAHAILLLYDISRPETFHRLRSFWLPFIESKKQISVILVGAKSDLRPMGANQQPYKEMVTQLLEHFHFVEISLECSSKAILNIQESFYFAQKAVLYPIAPLFDHSTATMRPAFVKALKRIFRIFDLDQDGLLNHQELDEFQGTCFGVRFEPDEFQKLVKVLENVKSGYVPNGGITVDGFLHLQHLFITKHRPETSWAVLRTLGYSDQLELIVPDAAVELPKHEADQSFYFTNHCLKYLSDVFDQFDKDHDDHLTREDLNEIFSIFPIPTVPWSEADAPQSSCGDVAGHHLSKSGWLGLWSRGLMMEPKTTLKHLFYLGYVESPATSIECHKGRKYSRQRSHVPLKNIHCLVFGSNQCGKTSLLDCLIMRSFSKTYHVTKKSRSVVNGVYGTQGQDRSEKFLIMTEASQEEIKQGDISFETADVVCLVFDPRYSESLHYLKDMQSKIPDNIPCVIVGSKADLLKPNFRESSNWLRAVDYCASLELAPPLLVSAKTGDHVSDPSSWVFSRLVDAAQFTEKSCPMTDSKREALYKRQRWKYVGISCVSVALITAAVVYASSKSSSDNRSNCKGSSSLSVKRGELSLLKNV